MKNKNIAIAVLIAVVILLTGYRFLDTNKGINGTSLFSTTTDMASGTSASGATTTKAVIKSTTSTYSGTYLKLGQKVLINGVYVTPGKVTYDSRCPKDVQCVQAGTVELGVLLERGSVSQNAIIVLNKPFSFAGKTVTLVSVAPTKISTKTIQDSEYRFLIAVR